jgi:epoxyqueuosine reductase QueG
MEKLIEIMLKCGVGDAATLKYDYCKIINTKLANQIQFTPKSVCIGTIPYYTHFCDNKKSVSSYALAYDYHLYIKKLGETIIAQAKEYYPNNNFVFFGDHSPIDEKNAAAQAGLGIIGEHSLLITPKHSSFVFLFEIISDLECDNAPVEISHCEKCGKCKKACPADITTKSTCLSLITQKKGTLSEDEIKKIHTSACAWGCDICQQVCPHTISAKTSGTLYTKDPWFNNNVLEHPTVETIEDAEDFKARAYSWRGKATILRNLDIINSEKR